MIRFVKVYTDPNFINQWVNLLIKTNKDKLKICKLK